MEAQKETQTLDVLKNDTVTVHKRDIGGLGCI
jgi:hypothetical protein